jgi:hypothetical protein
MKPRETPHLQRLRREGADAAADHRADQPVRRGGDGKSLLSWPRRRWQCARTRHDWTKLPGNAGSYCLRCGASRPDDTLRHFARRH